MKEVIINVESKTTTAAKKVNQFNIIQNKRQQDLKQKKDFVSHRTIFQHASHFRHGDTVLIEKKY